MNETKKIQEEHNKLQAVAWTALILSIAALGLAFVAYNQLNNVLGEFDSIDMNTENIEGTGQEIRNQIQNAGQEVGSELQQAGNEAQELGNESQVTLSLMQAETRIDVLQAKLESGQDINNVQAEIDFTRNDITRAYENGDSITEQRYQAMLSELNDLAVAIPGNSDTAIATSKSLLNMIRDEIDISRQWE